MIYVLSKNKKNITIFHLKIIIFTATKYCRILHGRVCVMIRSLYLDVQKFRKTTLVKYINNFSLLEDFQVMEGTSTFYLP